MKLNKLIIAVCALIVGVTFTSCSEGFSVPNPTGNEINDKFNKLKKSIEDGSVDEMSIAAFKKAFYTTKEPKEITTDIVIKGYVSSSDESGNYYKEFYLQDDPVNPTSGIRVELNLTNSHNQFNIGREVYIRLKGLFVGESRSGDGIATIGGFLDGPTKIDLLSTKQIPNHIIRSNVTKTLTPLNIKPSEINSSLIGVYVVIDGAHFLNPDDNTYFNPKKDFDTQRTLEACEGFGYEEFILETSSFSNFGTVPLPKKYGTIAGIISKDYNGKNFVMHLNKVSDVNMNGNACKPLNINDFDETINQDFESASGNIAITGWTNFNQEGTRLFRSYFDNHSSSKAAKIGSYKSGDASSISWLITNSINLDAYKNEFLSFETSNSFGDDSKLEALISTNWDGTTANISTATWTKLPAKIVDKTISYKKWLSSGVIDLSSFSGNAHIAFRYTGSGNTKSDGTYEIDNIKVLTKK